MITAIKAKNLCAIKWLLDVCIDVNEQNKDGYTALERVVTEENLEIDLIKFLLDKGADVDMCLLYRVLKVGHESVKFNLPCYYLVKLKHRMRRLIHVVIEAP